MVRWLVDSPNQRERFEGLGIGDWIAAGQLPREELLTPASKKPGDALEPESYGERGKGKGERGKGDLQY